MTNDLETPKREKKKKKKKKRRGARTLEFKFVCVVVFHPKKTFSLLLLLTQKIGEGNVVSGITFERRNFSLTHKNGLTAVRFFRNALSAFS